MNSGIPSTIDSLLKASGEEHAARPAVSIWGQAISFRDLSGAVDALADAIKDAANEKDIAGIRVGVISPNLPAMVVATFAIWRCGAVAVPINARFREYELARILSDADVTVCISVGTYRGYSFATLVPQLMSELPQLRAWMIVDPMGGVEDTVRGRDERATQDRLNGAVGAILYTSGTTGAPKGALVTHGREISGARCMGEILGLIPTDAVILVVPISHAFGLTCLLASIAAGAHAVMVESTFSSEPMLAAMKQHEATVLHGSPAIFTSLLKTQQGPLPSLRTGFVAGSACPPAVLEQLDDKGMRILNLFGMTEIGAAACCRSTDAPHVRYTTSGTPMEGYELRVAPHTNVETPGGEIQVRGPYVTEGYYRQPEQTAQAFDDGWFRTGDLGTIEPGGAVRISGRAKEVLQVGGLNVFPAEVEGFLMTHPDVQAAAVVGVPHDTMGEVLQAFVVVRPGADLTASELLQFARARIAGYKLPYGIHFLPDLPLLSSGKPDRGDLQRRAQSEQPLKEEEPDGASARTHPPF